jgi:hypothetical protein
MSNPKRSALTRTTRKEYWRQKISAWQKSGLSQAAFCRMTHLANPQFLYWKSRILRPPAPSVMVSVNNPGPVIPGRAVYELILSGNMRIRLDEYFDPETVKKLIRAVREA